MSRPCAATRAPIPAAWKTDAELRGVYYDSLDAASEPFKVRNAKPALKKCLDLSVKYQYFDEYSRVCEEWLAKNYKSEYHVVDELRGAPTLANSGLDEKSPPVLTDGTFWHPPAPAPEKTTVSTTSDDSGAAEPKKAGGGKPAAAKPAGKKIDALQKPLTPSPELAVIVGKDMLPRGQVVSKVWEYIKKHDLQKPTDKRQIVADANLKKVFGVDECSMFEMNKHLARHLK